MQSKKDPHLRILIVGAGIAGLTLANLLEQQQMTFDIIERMPDWSHPGYSLGIWPLGSRILKGLGLFNEFVKKTTPLEEYFICNNQGKKISYVRIRDLLKDEEMIRMITRKELTTLLLQNIKTKVQMGITVQNLLQKKETVEITFSNKKTKEYDLVVGADGIHSQIREFLFGRQELEDTEWGGFAFWTDPSYLSSTVAKEYWHAGKFLGLYPAKNALLCLVGMPTSKMPEDKKHPSLEFLQKNFSSMGLEAPKIFQKLSDKDTIFFWPFSDLRQTQWLKGRCVLLGDSSSTILPTAGIGTTCAMESAAVLSDELRRVNAKTIPNALDLYFKRRFRRVDKMQRESRFVAKITFIDNKALAALRNFLLKFYPSKNVFKTLLRLLNEPL